MILNNICIFFMGAGIFSFLNVIIYRVPKKLSFIKGRSFCPRCHTQLKFYDLIPILSYLFLRGKCRYCNKVISIYDTINEVIGGILLLQCFKDRNGLIVFMFFCILDIISLIDIYTMEIDDKYHIIIILLSIISMFVFKLSIIDRLIGFLCVSMPMYILTLFIKDGFGGGDIKLMAVSGFFMGYQRIIVSMYIALCIGGFYSLFLIIFKDKKWNSYFAFAPFLSIGMLIGWFYGYQFLYFFIT